MTYVNGNIIREYNLHRKDQAMRKTGSGEDSKLPKVVVPLFWTVDEVATMLRLSASSFEIVRKHPFYEPDSTRVVKKGRGNKKLPLWSTELVELFKDARREVVPGVRMFSDDEGLRVRRGLLESKRKEYIEKAEALV